MAKKHRDLTDQEELHTPKGFTEAGVNQGLIKNSVGALEWVPVSELGGAEGPPGTVQNITVSNIDDPSAELNAANLATYGRFVYVVQTPLGNDSITFYRYDDSNTDAENSPYVINTLDGGNTRWVAVGGKYSTQQQINLDGSRAISSAEQSKLAGIESGATADQSDAEIKTAYENNANTNAFEDAEKSKLAAIEAGAEANQTDSEIKVQYEANLDTNAYTDAEKSKLAAIEASATADQTGAEIKALYEAESNTNAFTDAEQTKLTNIESNATQDQTGAEIKIAYEAELDTNAFTDSEKSKLAGIEASATADQTGAEIKIAYEAEADTNAFTDAEQTKLAAIESGATADQTGAEIKVAYEAEANTNAFTDAEKSKLASLESSKFLGEYVSLAALQAAHPSPAVGTYANVDTGVGQDVVRYIWDSDDNAFVLVAGDSAALTDAQIKTQYENNADTNAFTDSEKTKLAGIESGATADQTGAEIKVAYEAELDTNAYTDSEKSKLAGIESSATADQTGAEIKVAYEAEANTNAFTDAEQTKLAGIAASANNYSHPNHTGEVTSTGDGAQVVSSTAITNKTTIAATDGDFLLVSDTDDSGNLKKMDVADVRNVEHAIVQATRTTAQSVTNTPVNLTLDTTNIETDATRLDHDNVNRDRIIIKEATYCYASVNLEIRNTANADRTFTLTLRLNGTTILSTQSFVITKSTTSMTTRTLFLPVVTPNDYFTIEMTGSSAGSDVTVEAGARVCIFTLS